MKRRHFLRMFGLGVPAIAAAGSSGLIGWLAKFFKREPKVTQKSFLGKMIAVDRSKYKLYGGARGGGKRFAQMQDDMMRAWENVGLTITMPTDAEWKLHYVDNP